MNNGLRRAAALLIAIGLVVGLQLGPGGPQLALASVDVIRVAVSGADFAGCGSETQPCKTLQFAVDAATSGTWILVATGTYHYDPADNLPTPCYTESTTAPVVCILNKKLDILGGFTTSDWQNSDPVAHPTIIDGQDQYRGVLLQRTNPNDPAASLRMEGFTIQNCRAQGKSNQTGYGSYAFGAGMLVDASPVTFRNINFRHNVAIGGNNTNEEWGGAGSGGGLALRAVPSGLLEYLTFDDNQAYGGSGNKRGGYAAGGGLFTYRSAVWGKYITITNNLAQAGSSSGSGKSSDGERADAQGGGAAIKGGSYVPLQFVTIRDNQAIAGNAATYAGGSFGGGVTVEAESFGASMTLIDADVRGNLALGGNAANGWMAAGGGIDAAGAALWLERVTVIDNSTVGGNGSAGDAGSAAGGGMHLTRFHSDSTRVSIINCVVADNYVAQGTSGQLIGAGGGGIWLQGVDADIVHTTVAGNDFGSPVMQGQGILLLNVSAPPTVAHIYYSIIADHTDADGVAALHVQTGNTAYLERTLWAGNDHNTNAGWSGVGTIHNNNALEAPSALFVSPEAPNYDYHLQHTSPARNQAWASETAADIDLQLRMMFGDPDIGADEYAPIILATQGVASDSLWLRWNTSADLIPDVNHYDIFVSCPAGASPPDQGACDTPIYAARLSNYLLTGLTTSAQYTIVIQAQTASHTLLESSNAVQDNAAAVYLFIPITRK